MNDDGYFVPLTINEFIDGLKGIIKNSNDLTGEELITGIQYIGEGDDCDIPSGGIAIFLKQATMKPDEPRYGTIMLSPTKVRQVM